MAFSIWNWCKHLPQEVFWCPPKQQQLLHGLSCKKNPSQDEIFGYLSFHYSHSNGLCPQFLGGHGMDDSVPAERPGENDLNMWVETLKQPFFFRFLWWKDAPFPMITMEIWKWQQAGTFEATVVGWLDFFGLEWSECTLKCKIFMRFFRKFWLSYCGEGGYYTHLP